MLEPGTCCSESFIESGLGDYIGYYPMMPIPEYSICQNPRFCDPTGETGGSCCGSCLPFYMQMQAAATQASAGESGAPNINENDDQDEISQKVQAQTWDQGMAQCVADGTGKR